MDDARFDPRSARAVEQLLAPYGAFFHLSLEPVPGCLPIDELSPAPFCDRTRAGLATSDQLPTGQGADRVVASLAQLDLAARVVSPLLALAVHGRPVAPTGTEIQIGLTAALEGTCSAASAAADRIVVNLPGAGLRRGVTGSDGVGERDPAWAEAVLALLARLSKVFAPQVGSRRILDGNIASAVTGAATVLFAVSPATSTQVAYRRALLLGHPALQAAWTAPPFRRRSCCLYYRTDLARRPLCGDCVLAR